MCLQYGRSWSHGLCVSLHSRGNGALACFSVGVALPLPYVSPRTHLIHSHLFHSWHSHQSLEVLAYYQSKGGTSEVYNLDFLHFYTPPSPGFHLRSSQRGEIWGWFHIQPVNQYFLCNSLSKGRAVSHDLARMGRLADSAPVDKSSLLMKNWWSCKVVSTEVQSVNASKADRIAFLPVCTLRHTGSGAKELKKNSMGLSLGCLSVPEFLLLGEWKPWKGRLPSSLFVSDGCVKSGGGMFGTRSLFKQKPRGGSGGDVWWIRRQVCCSAALLSLLQEIPIMHCMPSHKILYGLGFGARSLTNLPAASVFFFFMNSLLSQFSLSCA